MQSGESWCIYGGSSSGATALLQLLEGRLKNYSAASLQLPQQIYCLSFCKQQQIFEEELAKDNSDFLDYPDPGTLVREFLPEWKKYRSLLQALDMECCLDTGYRQLSSGQNRKLLLLMAFAETAECMVLESPFDGLDKKSCTEVKKTLELSMNPQQSLLIFTNNRSDIGKWCKWCSHLAIIDQGKLLFADTMPKGDELLSRLACITEERVSIPSFFSRKKDEELVLLQNGFARYGEKQIFSGLNLRITSGGHTLVTGRNGCGKSTLFDIITGDNVLCYGNDLRILGRKRGSGESVWQIKKEMGIVSPALHRDHRRVGSCLEVVLSGLFDSIGLYTKVMRSEVEQAKKWLQWTGFANLANTPFKHLEYGKQRLILIARALVKEPRLLMLDEPTQGLDDFHRKMLLDLLEKIADTDSATIFYISHREDEYRSFFRQKIALDCL